MRGVFAGVLAILCTIFVPSVAGVDVNIGLLNGDIAGLLLHYDIISGNKTVQGTANSSDLKFDLEPGFYEITLSHDDLSTPGYDLYGSISANIERSTRLMISMLPVGSIRIEVTDKKGVLLKDVLVKVGCDRNYGEQGYFHTDEFGIIDIRYAPASSCNIKSALDDYIISSNVEVLQGSRREVKMQFTEYSSRRDYSLMIFIIVVVFIAVTLFILWKGRKTNNIKKEIVNALEEKEQRIVNFLIEEIPKSPGKCVSQNKIVYGTGIAKTSLCRILGCLERKNIITVEKIGKMKKIAFTDSFSNK